MVSPTLSDWSTYLAVQAGAAATLTGLVFVAVSLNVNRIMSFAGLSSRAGESLLQLLGVFFISGAALIPGESAKFLGFEILAIALVSWLAQVAGQVRYLFNRSGHPLTWLTVRAAGAQLATLPFFVAGVELIGGMPSAPYWLALGFAFSFMAALFSAWVLLIEILR